MPTTYNPFAVPVNSAAAAPVDPAAAALVLPAVNALVLPAANALVRPAANAPVHRIQPKILMWIRIIELCFDHRCSSSSRR